MVMSLLYHYYESTIHKWVTHGEKPMIVGSGRTSKMIPLHSIYYIYLCMV